MTYPVAEASLDLPLEWGVELISPKVHGSSVGRLFPAKDSKAHLPTSGYTVSGEQLATEQDTVIFFSMRRIFNGLKGKLRKN